MLLAGGGAGMGTAGSTIVERHPLAVAEVQVLALTDAQVQVLVRVFDQLFQRTAARELLWQAVQGVG